MKVNIHILSELIALKDPAFVSVHEVDLDDESDSISISYDVVVPAKKIAITKKEYREYIRNVKIDTIINETNS